MYDRYWADWYLPAALPALEEIFFKVVPAGAKVLDVCCGSGHVTGELVRRDYRVTGVDKSSELIERARERWPGTVFSVQDVCQMQLPDRYDAALSTFDSLNHLLRKEDLSAAFAQVFLALRAGGTFVFDMNGEEAWTLDLREWHVTLEDDSVALVRGRFDPAEKLAATQLVWFVRDGECWQRRDSEVLERCYSEIEIREALESAGFGDIEMWAADSLGVRSPLGFGRWFFRTRKRGA